MAMTKEEEEEYGRDRNEMDAINLSKEHLGMCKQIRDLKAEIATIEKQHLRDKEDLLGHARIIKSQVEAINSLKAERDEYKRKLETATEVGEALTKAWNKLVKEHVELAERKGHEYQISQMLDKSLGFLEKKVEKADNLVRNPHKLLFTKAKGKEK
jgi:hypothetical protein